MSARIIPVATALCTFCAPALAETPAANAESTLGMASGETQPVMDRGIFAHAIFNQLEGRWNGSNTQFRWDGQGWIGTDYGKLWIKSEGTLQSSGTVDDGQQQFLYSRAVTTYFDLQGGLRSDIDSRPTRNWGALGIRRRYRARISGRSRSAGGGRYRYRRSRRRRDVRGRPCCNY